MRQEYPARLLRIHVSEGDRFQGKPLYEAIVAKCRELKIAGATVFRGLEGYGESAEMHRSHLARHDQPILISIVDSADNLSRLVPVVEEMMDTGLIAVSDVQVTACRRRLPRMKEQVRESAQSQGQPVPLFGRRDEVRTLTSALCARKSCLVLGPKGIGKTRLLQESLSIARQPYVYVEGPEVLHRLLVELAERLSCPAGRFGSVRNATSVALKPSVLEAFRRLPRCLVLEDFVDADPRMYRFLQRPTTSLLSL